MEINHTEARAPPGTAVATKGGIHKKPLTNYAKISHKEKEEVMRRTIRFALTIVFLAVVTVGCDTDVTEPTESTLSESQISMNPGTVPDLTGPSGQYYGPENAYTIVRISEMMATDLVQNEMKRFNDLGFTFSEDNCFVISAIFGDQIIEFAYITLEHDEYYNTRVGEIACATVTDDPTIELVPFILHIGNELRIDDMTVWDKTVGVKLLDPATGINGLPLYKPAWSWKKWLKCSFKGFVSAGYGTAAGCAFAGPAYGQCVAAGLVGGGVASMASCAVDQLMD